MAGEFISDSLLAARSHDLRDVSGFVSTKFSAIGFSQRKRGYVFT
jgi:hypothetical protein